MLNGLDLGGVAEFTDPRIITIETGGHPAFKDDVGITGNTIPPDSP